MKAQVVAWYAALPRAGRWALWGAAVLAGYFLVIEPMVSRAVELHETAARQAALLVALERDAASGRMAALVSGARRHGPVDLPGDAERMRVAFNRRVDEVLSQHGVRRHENIWRTAVLTQGPLPRALTGDGLTPDPAPRRVERVIREVQFMATPEQVAAVVADLERSREVSAVSRVQMRRADREGASRDVRATIAAEVWTITQGRRR